MSLTLRYRWTNHEGLCSAKVWDRLDTIFKIYGKTEVSDRGGYGLIGYNVGETDATLLFFIKDDRVFKIQLWFNYT
jgi:hypothetical protein